QGTTRALTVGSDGSVYVLAGFNEQTTTPAWTLFVYAPGATSASAPERVISGSGHPQEVVLVADGIDVRVCRRRLTDPYAGARLQRFGRRGRSAEPAVRRAYGPDRRTGSDRRRDVVQLGDPRDQDQRSR